MQLESPAFVFAALLALGYGAMTAPISAISPDDCRKQSCGGIQVRYPFKLANATHCSSFAPSFDLTCDTLSGHLFFTQALVDGSAVSRIRVLALSNTSLALDVSAFRAGMKMGSHGVCETDIRSIDLSIFPSPYVFSQENYLGAFGCVGAVLLTADSAQTNAFFRLKDLSSYSNLTVGGCHVACYSNENSDGCRNGRCCVFPWPAGFFPRRIAYATQQSFMSNATYEAENCSSGYAVIFHPAYSTSESQTFGIKLDWALPSNHTTIPDIVRSAESKCSGNAEILIAKDVPGYRCSCRAEYHGDGYAEGSQCTGNSRKLPIRIGIITMWGLLIVGFVVGCICSATMHQRWRHSESRDTIERNVWNALESRRLFKEEELDAATDNYSSSMRLGLGGSGTVFQGALSDGTMVAIKKAKKFGNSVQILNELEIVMRINHQNIVKFLGCCLETEEPLLVYEFLPNGNVYQNLRKADDKVMNWEQRLKVAMQTADALAYLHKVAVPPVLHRDVKSSNVLLDNNFDAKVADFGVSCLIPEGKMQAPTMLKGTIGYVDPEYFQTFQLTEKSDVYSFGVLLAELVTGLKPVDSRGREARFANLAFLFTHYMGDQASIEELIDARLLAHDGSLQTRSSIRDLSALALQCLSLHGSQRPPMSKVAHELGRMRCTYLNSSSTHHLHPTRPISDLNGLVHPTSEFQTASSSRFVIH